MKQTPANMERVVEAALNAERSSRVSDFDRVTLMLEAAGREIDEIDQEERQEASIRRRLFNRPWDVVPAPVTRVEIWDLSEAFA